MTADYIYSKRIQYMRKNKWRTCLLQIGLLRRCEETLMAILEDLNDKQWVHTFVIYGFECNNEFVSLIGASEIHLIKYETFELAPAMREILKKYIKDVSFKLQLKFCTSPESSLLLHEWYMMHVQTNGICITTDNGSKLVDKWNRSNIGQCHIKDCTLDIEIMSKKGRRYYSFYRDENYIIEKIFKAIQNLKFEYPSSSPDKLVLIPRRSGSVDIKGVASWGNSKELIARVRTCSSARTDDCASIADSSPPSTPCSLSCVSSIHINEKDEELMFPLDSLDSDSKTNVYSASNYPQTPSYDSDHKRLVDLERFPFESDLRSQGKLSPDLNCHNLSHYTTFIQNANVYEKSRNGQCYQTLDFIKHHRKTSSEANFVTHIKANDTKRKISQSVDVNRCGRDTFTTSSTDKRSTCSSPLMILSSSNISCDTNASCKGNDLESSCFSCPDSKANNVSPLRPFYSEPDHQYYNISSADLAISHQYPITTNEDDNYYNLKPSPVIEYQNTSSVIQDGNAFENNPILSYAELDFKNTHNEIISKKSIPCNNYTEINHHDTEVLRDFNEDYFKNKNYKKKKPKSWKLFSKN